MEFLAAITLCGCAMLLAWALMGGALFPVDAEGMLTLWRLEGDAPDLEKTVRGLHRLRSAGLLSSTVVMLDCGLSPEARKRAEILARDELWLHLIAEKDLCTYFDFSRADHGTGI